MYQGIAPNPARLIARKRRPLGFTVCVGPTMSHVCIAFGNRGRRLVGVGPVLDAVKAGTLTLYHGTRLSVLPSILASGLQGGPSYHPVRAPLPDHVHLSPARFPQSVFKAAKPSHREGPHGVLLQVAL